MPAVKTLPSLHQPSCTPPSLPPSPLSYPFKNRTLISALSSSLKRFTHTWLICPPPLAPCRAATCLPLCQDAFWADKRLASLVFWLHLSLLNNKTALCLSLHVSPLLISVDRTPPHPSSFLLLQTLPQTDSLCQQRHQIKMQRFFNCVPST